MPKEPRNEAYDLMERSVKSGPASRARILAALAAMSASGRWKSSVPPTLPARDAPVVMAEYKGLISDEEHAAEGTCEILRAGFSFEGFYVLSAFLGGWDDRYCVRAFFLPYGARSAGDDALVFRDYQSRSLPGERLLKPQMLRASERRQAGEVAYPLSEDNRQRWTANVEEALEAIRLHDEGVRAAPAGLGADDPSGEREFVSARCYPTQQLRGMRWWQEHVWVHAVPDRGHFVVLPGPEQWPFMLTMEGHVEAEPEDIDLDTVFRRTDEEMDPGLSARIELGLERLREERRATGHDREHNDCMELADADDIPF